MGWLRGSMAALAVGLLACGDEGSDRGTAVFSSRGEASIEQPIPADPTGAAGFSDGWTLKFDKFLIAFYDIKLADKAGRVGARMFGSRFVDNAKPGPKTLVQFTEVPARSWDAVSYVVAPATYDTSIVAGDTADRDMMAANGYSLYAQGSASKNGVTKTFRWGFKTSTAYESCQQPALGGAPIAGVVISNGETDTSELTTRGERLFAERLSTPGESPLTPAKLRFDALAAADVPGDGFGEITMDELMAIQLDPLAYSVVPFTVTSLGELVTALSRTVGHFRGTGECTVSVIR